MSLSSTWTSSSFSSSPMVCLSTVGAPRLRPLTPQIHLLQFIQPSTTPTYLLHGRLSGLFVKGIIQCAFPQSSFSIGQCHGGAARSPHSGWTTSTESSFSSPSSSSCSSSSSSRPSLSSSRRTGYFLALVRLALSTSQGSPRT